VVIEPNVTIGPAVSIADGVVIRSFCHIEGAEIAAGAVIGPFARLRPGARIGEGAHIGNFVEVKNARIAAGAKANHLAYLGDADVGAGANIGAGTITCNYDGAAKHRTEIGANAFIGSNSALVAPVKIGEGAYVGSGSVITRDVPPDALAWRGAPGGKGGLGGPFPRQRGEAQETGHTGVRVKRMCGIVGILGQRPAAADLVEALARLEYRGYDSAGIVVLEGGSFKRVRAAGKLSELKKQLHGHHLTGTTGIGHTRWATHGAPPRPTPTPISPAASRWCTTASSRTSASSRRSWRRASGSRPKPTPRWWRSSSMPRWRPAARRARPWHRRSTGSRGRSPSPSCSKARTT
jgi:acetyltransferase-like isoleucine patch superfamily enzyme